MCNKAVAIFNVQNIHNVQKREKEKKPKTAPWLSIPEPPKCTDKGKKRRKTITHQNHRPKEKRQPHESSKKVKTKNVPRNSTNPYHPSPIDQQWPRAIPTTKLTLVFSIGC